MPVTSSSVSVIPEASGLPIAEVRRWLAGEPDFPSAPTRSPNDCERDAQAATGFFTFGEELLGRLPAKGERTEAEQAAAEALQVRLRAARLRFLRAYAEELYAELTDRCRRFLRVDELVYRAAERYPGLTPTRAQVRADLETPLRQKAGVELDQGIFLSQVLSCSRAGAHLIHAMLRPRAESEARLEEFRRTGAVDLGTAYVRREGNVGWLYLRNTRYLNAEDDTTVEALETGVDLVLLDPEIEAGVLRGAMVDHPRYAGRHVFNAGLNLTRLYQGQLSYLFCITRELGFVSKLYRGLTGPEFYPREPEATLEKPWIGAVEAFAIGGGCQLMLVLDYVVAETGSFFNLPAPREGLIPGVANLRLTRFVGDRLARQGIFCDRQFPADSPEGRLLCDEVVAPEAMVPAIRAAVERLAGPGMVSVSANRKALRVGHEPLSALQAYMTLYAREQAYAYFSAGLVHNLETNWVSRKRPAR